MMDKYLSAAAVSDATSIAESTLATWRAVGFGPVWVKVGRRRVAYRETDVQAWLDARAAATERRSA